MSAVCVRSIGGYEGSPANQALTRCYSRAKVI